MSIKTSGILKSALDQIKLDVQNKLEVQHVPNIIEFCESPYYLDLEGRGVKLYPIQRIVLKIFYRGQPGNENLILDDEELTLLRKYKLDHVIDKYYSGNLFRELVLVFGRRSGKNMLCSLIALYETMRLLEMPGGDLFKYYSLESKGNPVYILSVAAAAPQAKILFTEIKEKMLASEYFSNKIAAIKSEEIFLLTAADKKNQQKMLDDGFDNTHAKTNGSIVIMAGHSNSETLVGKRIYCLLFDEVAAYKSSSGPTSGDKVYTLLSPCTADFKRKVGIDENGNDIFVTDSKIISISSPRAEEGMLFKLYNDAPNTANRLAVKLSTWKVNPRQREEDLRKEFSTMSPEQFNMEFGAQFSGTAGEKYIPDQLIDQAVSMGSEIGLEQRIYGVRGQLYYAHLDPASSSHNYALVVVHLEERVLVKQDKGILSKIRKKFVVVDHIKIWYPDGIQPIRLKDVDEYILNIAKRFKLGMVTYDAWNSLSSVQLLKSKGIPCRITPFRKSYKMAIYDNLENLFTENQLILPSKGPHAELLQLELKCLKRVYTPSGYSIRPNPDGLVATDDCADALAGASYVAMDTIYKGFPASTVVRMPVSRSIGSHQWHIGRGTYNENDRQWNFIKGKIGY